MRENIKRFAEQMEIELQHNSHKGDISEFIDFNAMITELEYHKAKMMLAVRCKNPYAIKEYIADCGNILMAIGNKFGCYDTDTVDLDIAHELRDGNVISTVNVAGQNRSSLV